MTTISASYDFKLTAAQLIARCAKNLGILAAGGTIVSADETELLQTLNVVAKEFQGSADLAPGLKVWNRQRITMMFEYGQQTYTIGPAATDARSSTQVGRATIDVAEASGQTVLSVANTSDTTSYPGTTLTMTAADIIGVEMDDGTLHWSTVASISAGDTVTIDGATDDTAAVGNVVYWFTTRAQRFPVLESVVIRDKNLKDIPLQVYRTVEDYEAQADKYVDGRPTCVLVEPSLLLTRLTFNSQPTDVTDTVVLTVLYPANDYDATTDDIAFPQEWLGALEWEVTLRSCPMYGKAWTPEMELNRKNAMSRALSLNPEVSNVYFQADAE